MSRRIHALIALLGVVSALATGFVAVPAAIAAPNAVTSDCNGHGRLTKTYTEAQLKLALSTLPPEVKQYTNCYDVINRALLAAIAGKKPTGTGGGGGSGGSFLPTPVIVIIVLLALAGATFGALAVRRRREQGADSLDASEPPGDGHEPPGRSA